MTFAPKLKIGIVIFLVIAFFVVLNQTNFAKKIKNFFYLVSEPVQKTLWKAGDGAADFFAMILEIKNLKKENEELKLKILELLSENVALRELKKENEILREALGIGLEKDFKLQIAEVIGKDISQDFILINKGSRDAIRENLPVITQQKVLVGKIAEVYENFSKVALLSNKESSLDVKIEEKDLTGIVKGGGNLRLFLDLVPKEKEIEEGDLLITTSLSRIYPGGLLVGEIKKVEKSDIEPFQGGEIKPAFVLKEMERLFVITEF